VIGVGIFLARERLDVTVAVLVGVIDDPGLLGLPLFGVPTAFTNGNGMLLLFKSLSTIV